MKAQNDRWITRPISKTCEYSLSGIQNCGNPTTHAYKAAGMGWMALCADHANPHLEYADKIDDLIRAGETFKATKANEK